jgi:DNA-binding SARP family transcriptional activator
MLAFEILGPLVVRGDDGEIPISGARRRALFLRLLVTANELVPAGPLAEDLWEGSPTTGAAATLQNHISQLRKSLGPGRLQSVPARFPVFSTDALVAPLIPSSYRFLFSSMTWRMEWPLRRGL